MPIYKTNNNFFLFIKANLSKNSMVSSLVSTPPPTVKYFSSSPPPLKGLPLDRKHHMPTFYTFSETEVPIP